MAVTLGTRKRRSESDEEELVDPNFKSDIETSDLRTLFKRHFEAQFEPLPEVRSTTIAPAEDEERGGGGDDSGSAWEGLSDEDEPAAELIQYNTSLTAISQSTKEEYKTYMTSKPPSSTKSLLSKGRKKLLDDPDTSTDAANLKKDLALQRMLRESHLLSPSGPPSNLSHSGVNRHRALDMRLQDMGSKSSIFKQEKMPLAQRKGILAKTKLQEENRRQEAFENGIILEKAKAKKRSNGLRKRGIGAPAVGRFQGGTLKLSRKDVAEIEGPRKIPMGGKGGKRRKR